jgi:hypothetical protein
MQSITEPTVRENGREWHSLITPALQFVPVFSANFGVGSFYLPYATPPFDHRARTRCMDWGVGTLCGDFRLPVALGCCLSTTVFLLVVLTSLAYPDPGTSRTQTPWCHSQPWILVCLGVHMSLCIGCRDRLSAGPSPTDYPTGLSLQYVGYLPLVKRISSCIRARRW